MTDRFANLFNALKARKDGALVPFVNLCDPTPEKSLEILETLTEAGADAFELGIPFSDPTYNTYQDLMDLPGHIFDEMAHFFTVYKALEGKEAVAGDVNDRKAAIRVIQHAMGHYAECFLGGAAPRVDHRHSDR